MLERVLHAVPVHPSSQAYGMCARPSGSRYRVERQFSGRFAEATPLGCILFSCNGRGQNMYDEADHDTAAIAEAIGEGLPIGGFFCNGEMGPLGVKGIAATRSRAELKTYLHGFTSVFALMYDMAPPAEQEAPPPTPVE